MLPVKDAWEGTSTRQGGLGESGHILDRLPAAAYTCDAEGRITYFNARAARLWGREPKLNDHHDRFCGSFRLRSLDDEPIPHEQCWMALALREDREYQERELVIEQPDGSRRFVVAHASPFHDEQGQVSGALNVLLDITDRKRIEDALREEEARKSAILNSALDAVVSMDHQGRILDFNRAAMKMFGYRAEDVAGRPLAETIIPPRLRERHHTAFERYLRTGVGGILDRRVEMPALRRDGSEFPAELTVTVTKLPERPPFFTAYLRDLTEQKQAEEARREIEERFASFMQHLPAAAWIKDAQGRYVYANEYAQRIFRTPLEQLHGKTDLEVFPPATARQFRENDRRAHDNRQVLQTIEQLEHEDGIVHESVVNKFPIFDVTGEVAFIGGVAIDVTEQRRAVRALQASESKLRALLNNTRACIFAKDLGGRYIIANKSVAELFGWPDEAFGLGKTDYELHPPEQADVFVVNDRKVLEGGQAVEVEEVLQGPDGPRTYLVHKFPLRDADERIYAVCGIASEITERKRAVEELRHSEERYRRLTELLPVAVYTCQAPAGTITYFNNHAAALWGRAPEVGDTEERFCGAFRLWRPDGTLLPHERTPMAVALREGREFRNENVIIERPDGTRIDVLVNIDPLRDADDRVVGAINAFHDTTEWNRVQEALRESEHRFRTLANNAPVGIFETDVEGDCLFVNAAWCAMAGLTPEEARGQGWVQALHPQDRDRVFREWYAAAQTGDEFASEYRFRTSDENVTWLQGHAVPLRDDAGQIRGHLGTIIDVTQTKRAADIVRESEERFRQLAEHINQVFWVSDLQKNNVLYVSPAYERIWGRTCQSLYEQPRSFLDAVHPDDRERVLSESLGRQARGESSDVEYRVTHRDGSLRWVRDRSFPVKNEAGQVYRMVGIAQDITERKLADESLREADRRKDAFLAMLAHELRNPLAPIRSGLELMKLVPHDPGTIEDIRSIMERQTQQLIALVDDLLEVSRITRGKLELRKCRVDLASVVQSAVEAVRPLLDEAGHDFTIDVPARPLLMEADPHRLAQVLSNLLHNAAKYTPQGGRIGITAQRSGGDVVLVVKDTGIGIPSNRLDGIFEMFAQIECPQEKGHTGLGLGLTLVKLLVELHGGRVEAHSDGVNKGSSFTVRLPLLSDGHGSDDGPARDDAGNIVKSKRRVLVVDDNQAAVDMLSRLVKIFGNEVRTAGDGRQAIEVAAEFQPEVILMDLGMPHMDGYEAARHIRQQPWGQQMMLVALTGWGQDKDKQRTKAAGFNRHLVKPAEARELQQLFVELETDPVSERV